MRMFLEEPLLHKQSNEAHKHAYHGKQNVREKDHFTLPADVLLAAAGEECRLARQGGDALHDVHRQRGVHDGQRGEALAFIQESGRLPRKQGPHFHVCEGQEHHGADQRQVLTSEHSVDVATDLRSVANESSHGVGGRVAAE